MPRESVPTVAAPSSYLSAIRDPGRNLRDRYVDDPIALAERFHLKLPQKPLQVMRELGLYDPDVHGPIEPGLRDLVEDVCTGQVTSAAVVGPRGGGKSMGVSFIEFDLVFLHLYDALNLGGSELQADQVYQYLLGYIESDAFWRQQLKGEALQSRTETIDGAWIRVLAASQKSVRSPHAGGRKSNGRLAGGILVIDEEAEAAADIVEAALPTVNTARPSVVVRSSTFHNAEGSFADLIDNHVEMGFKLYRWDIFDVSERCECVGGCQSPEPCFREDHVEQYVDPEDGQLKDKLVHKAYCGGRAAYADGWIPMVEIEALWKRMKRNHARWEVEAMGSRPASSGHVIKDLNAFAKNITTETGPQLYVPGGPITVCVDWGTTAAGVTVWQEQFGGVHAQLHADLIQEAGQTQILGVILGYVNLYLSDFLEVAADIGGGGNYLNPTLREDHRVPVRDVNFAEEKEAAVAAWNIFNEANKCKYPSEHQEFAHQVRNWKRKNGRIAKGNDHLCDSSICYFSKFIDRLGLSNVRVPPRSFNAGGPPAQPRDASPAAAPEHRVALMRGIRSKRR
jgi:hypothetical protein